MKRVLSIILCAVMACGSLVAQVTLEECRQKARLHYPAIAMYDVIAATERYTLKNAAMQWLPQGSLGGQMTWLSEVNDLNSIENWDIIETMFGIQSSKMSQWQGKVTLDLMQNVWDGGKSASDRKVARADADVRRGELQRELYKVEERVDQLFFAILLMDDNIRLTQQKLQVLDRNMQDMRLYLSNGVAMPMDVDMLQVECLSAQQLLDNLHDGRLRYLRMLSLLTGMDLSAQTLLRPAMPADAPGPMSLLHPELQYFSRQQALLDAQMSRLNVSVMPTLALFGQGWYGYPGLDLFKSVDSHDPTFNAVVGIKLNWNFSALYFHRGQRSILRASRQAYDVQRDVFLFNTSLANEELKGKTRQLQQTIATDRRIVELRQSVRMAMEARQQNGVVDAASLLLKIAEENQALISLSTHETELLKVYYEINHNNGNQ